MLLLCHIFKKGEAGVAVAVGCHWRGQFDAFCKRLGKAGSAPAILPLPGQNRSCSLAPRTIGWKGSDSLFFTPFINDAIYAED